MSWFIFSRKQLKAVFLQGLARRRMQQKAEQGVFDCTSAWSKRNWHMTRTWNLITNMVLVQWMLLMDSVLHSMRRILFFGMSIMCNWSGLHRKSLWWKCWNHSFSASPTVAVKQRACKVLGATSFVTIRETQGFHIANIFGLFIGSTCTRYFRRSFSEGRSWGSIYCVI